MQFDDTEIREFIDLWRDEFGETLPKEDARHLASQLVRLYEILASIETMPGYVTEESVTQP